MMKPMFWETFLNFIVKILKLQGQDFSVLGDFLKLQGQYFNVADRPVLLIFINNTGQNSKQNSLKGVKSVSTKKL